MGNVAKIESLQGDGSWEQGGKTWFSYELVMSDGYSGHMYTTRSMQELTIAVGDEVSYDRAQNKKGNPTIKNAKKIDTSGGGGGKSAYVPDDKRQEMIVRQSSLNRAVELMIAGKANDKNLMQLADYFTDWVMGRQKAIDLSEVKPKEQDDLPF